MVIWQGMVYPGRNRQQLRVKLRHRPVQYQRRHNNPHHRGWIRMRGNQNSHLRRLVHMGSSNKAYLRRGIHMVGNEIHFRKGPQVPLLVIKVTNTVDNMEDVLSNAIRAVCVGSGVRTPSVILQFSGNRLLPQPNSHV